MSDAITSADPFRDPFAVSANLPNTDVDIHGIPAAIANKLYPKTASRPAMVAVPILEPLSPISTWSPQSSVSTLSLTSTALTSPTTETINAPIQWNNADLMYLLSCLLPGELITNQLVFSPPLDELPTVTYPVTLQLFKKTPIAPPSREAYSKHAPIGTGRPRPHTLIAESDQKCSTAVDARRSLARALLRAARMVCDAVDKHDILTTLHHLPTPALHSIHRSLLLMSSISDAEWIGRLCQLRGFVAGDHAVEGVDYNWAVEARLEKFFLDAGRVELEDWVKIVRVALALGERDRRVWAEVYGDVASFLQRAVREMFGIWGGREERW